jgi:glycerophosphoryl diester phosphodiesterase
VSRRRLLVGAAVALVLTVAVVIAWPWVRIYRNAAPPDQFYRSLPPSVTVPHRQVLGIAHNAGNNAATTQTALAYGADVIEIDVITARGVLVAGRPHGWRWLADRVFSGQSLARAWQHAAPAKIIKLDLQQTDRALLAALAEFLHQTRPEHAVLVSTRDPAAIEYLRPRLPASVRLLFTVAAPDAEQLIRTDTDLRRAVAGLSVFQGLVHPDLVRWAHEHRLLVVAWTVNDGGTLDRLLHAGVDGVTTANLAILRALSR